MRLGVRQLGRHCLDPALPWRAQRRWLDQLIPASLLPRGTTFAEQVTCATVPDLAEPDATAVIVLDGSISSDPADFVEAACRTCCPAHGHLLDGADLSGGHMEG
jgi:hypothetical protein